MVHIEQRRARHVAQWRKLVHPATVIALIVGLMMRRGPPVQHKRGFDLWQCALRNQDIDVRKHATFGRRQPGKEIGCALQQNDIEIELRQSPCDIIYLSPYGVLLRSSHDKSSLEMRTRRSIDLVQNAVVLQRDCES